MNTSNNSFVAPFICRAAHCSITYIHINIHNYYQKCKRFDFFNQSNAVPALKTFDISGSQSEDL